MEILTLILAMVGVGVLIGGLAGVLWKDERPLGPAGDILVAVITAVVVGLADWFVIPALGLSDTLKVLAVTTEPALAALVVLWLIRRSRR